MTATRSTTAIAAGKLRNPTVRTIASGPPSHPSRTATASRRESASSSSAMVLSLVRPACRLLCGRQGHIAATTVVNPDERYEEGTDMRTPRLAGLGLVSMAAVALAVAGCDNSTSTTPGASSAASPSAGSSSAAAADPAAVSALSAATAKLDQTSFKITVTSGSGFKLTGALDAPHGVGTADVTATGPNASV